MAWTLLQYEIFQQLELWHEKESALCHRNDKYWSSLENQLARLRSIIHHKSHHEMTYFALYLFTLCSHFTTLPHLTWLRVVKTPGSGSWLSPECRSRLRPGLWQAAGPPYTGWKQTPKLQSAWKHLYSILSSYWVPLQSPVLFTMLDYVPAHIKYSALILLRCPGEMLWLRLRRQADGCRRQGFWTRDTGEYFTQRRSEWCYSYFMFLFYPCF